MFAEIAETMTLAPVVATVAFVSGWIVAKVGSWFSRRSGSRSQDPRDSRIRSLEADVRVAQSAGEKNRARLEAVSTELAEANKTLAAKDKDIAKQEATIGQLRFDLKESVKKTRELREELATRATENVRSEVKLREVETELSLVQASTDLIATGMLDYQTTDGTTDGTPPGEEEQRRRASKAGV